MPDRPAVPAPNEETVERLVAEYAAFYGLPHDVARERVRRALDSLWPPVALARREARDE